MFKYFKLYNYLNFYINIINNIFYIKIILYIFVLLNNIKLYKYNNILIILYITCFQILIFYDFISL